MAEQVDAKVSNTFDREVVRVRFPLRALHIFGVTSLALQLRTRSGYPRKCYEISREFTE